MYLLTQLVATLFFSTANAKGALMPDLLSFLEATGSSYLEAVEKQIGNEITTPARYDLIHTINSVLHFSTPTTENLNLFASKFG